MALIEFKDFSFKYALCSSPAVKNIDLSINDGEFVLLCGQNGSGKSTLLNCIKNETAPAGTRTGSILFDQTDIRGLSPFKSCSHIGLIRQNTDGQIVTDSVYSELVFGLENLGADKDFIRRRAAEISGYFGMGDWFSRPVDKLSGGQKQLLFIASALALNPRLLLLDEPTAQLDPIAAGEIIRFIARLCMETGTAVIIAEQRLEEIMPFCDRVVFMDEGCIKLNSAPKEICKQIPPEHEFFDYLPSAAKIFRKTGGQGECPLSVGDARKYLSRATEITPSHKSILPNTDDEAENTPHAKNNVRHTTADSKDYSVELKNVSFTYEKRSNDVISELSIALYSDEITCILGENAAGKTTLLRLLAGFIKPYSGKIRFKDKSSKIAYLPQDSKAIFCRDKLFDDILQAAKLSRSGSEAARITEKTLESYRLTALRDRHPFDLSGGETQRAALAKLSVADPNIYLLDEPEKGLDVRSKTELAGLLRALSDSGKTVVLVTHDMDFAARYTDRCIMLFSGNTAADLNTREFFKDNRFYTTTAARISSGFDDNAVTDEDVIRFCKENVK